MSSSIISPMLRSAAMRSIFVSFIMFGHWPWVLIHGQARNYWINWSINLNGTYPFWRNWQFISRWQPGIHHQPFASGPNCSPINSPLSSNAAPCPIEYLPFQPHASFAVLSLAFQSVVVHCEISLPYSVLYQTWDFSAPTCGALLIQWIHCLTTIPTSLIFESNSVSRQSFSKKFDVYSPTCHFWPSSLSKERENTTSFACKSGTKSYVNNWNG